VVIIYSIAAIPLWRVFAVARTWHPHLPPPSEAWLMFGVATWITQVLLASYSLGTLFQGQGQVLLAFVAGVGLNTYPQYSLQSRTVAGEGASRATGWAEPSNSPGGLRARPIT
jgi:hypothetical protein